MAAGWSHPPLPAVWRPVGFQRTARLAESGTDSSGPVTGNIRRTVAPLTMNDIKPRRPALLIQVE